MARPRSSKVPVGALTAVEHPSAEQIVGQFVGQWVRLVSTTNWEKGRIICAWREALLGQGASHTEYSDDAWAQLVGGVTSQHVGRLRRVFQRFGESHDQYAGLYWSHFQAAIDWDDAEMWLEGAIQNDWSVSQMRGQRWETCGTPDAPLPAEEPVDEGEILDADAGVLSIAVADGVGALDEPPTSRTATSGEEGMDEEGVDESAEDDAGDDEPRRSTSASMEKKATAAPGQRLAVDVDDLPADVAEAFESFKLAIIAHRRSGWAMTTPDAIQECLDALGQLLHAE